jgi:hypothetical protein
MIITMFGFFGAVSSADSRGAMASNTLEIKRFMGENKTRNDA